MLKLSQIALSFKQLQANFVAANELATQAVFYRKVL